VGIDLRREWPDALRRVGFDATKPTAWIAEGLFIGFLGSVTQGRLLNNVTALSAAGSRMAADYLPNHGGPFVSQEHALAESWRAYGFDGNMTEFTYADEQHDVAESIAALGWRTFVTDLADLFTATGLPGLRRQDLGEAPVAGRYVSATLT
jgi:methyltransferase (TIGR00027 family)